MKTKLSSLLIAPMLAAGAAAYAQCPVTITSSNGCAPTTLTVNAGFPVASITWILNGNPVQTYNATWDPNGITVAGGNGSGSNANQLSTPWFGNIDTFGNIIIADNGNYRVQKWAPGATTGTTVAGGNGAGSNDNQLTDVRGAFGLTDGTVFASDQENNRIMKWLPGATTGVVVAGGNGFGANADQLANQYCVVVDDTGNLYIGDWSNNRIQKWAPGATTGITVAGGNGAGNAPDQLNNPYGVYVDDSGNVYAMDVINNRVQKWAPGATSGTTVAGGNGYGTALNKMAFPFGVYVDKLGDVYVSDQGNNRITLWTPGATTGVLVAGGNGQGNAANQLNVPNGVWMDDTGNVYAADGNNSRVQKYKVSIVDTYNVVTQGTYTVIITGFNGCRDTIVYTPGIDATVAAGGPTTFCQGDTVKLHAPQGTGYTYQWTMNSGNISGATDSTYTAMASGTYAVNISNGGCSGISQNITVTVNPAPVPVITNTGGVLSVASGFATYQWYLNGSAITGATTNSYTSTGNGSYLVTVTNANGCSGSATLSLAVGSVNATAAINLYPNPANGVIYIANAPNVNHVSLSNMDGREVKAADNVNQLDLGQLPDNVYMIKIYGKDGQLLKIDKIIKTTNK